ncbi:cyanase [Corynebacterium oculi]|uniref:Cyanate hydratase n=1 Tax=Corynebacterium oculi TaxID=1544416 RepID=A0A0N8VZM4_9CORY|nr:cyanase [Corynebacterium oculi]KQB84306.1 Cyanate hydratase [Corynebacterium oculi]
MTQPILPKSEAAALITAQRIRTGETWAELAALIDAPVVWTTAALLGQHPMTEEQARTITEHLGFEGEERDRVVESLRLQPLRGSAPEVQRDPTIYRLHEALSVYGPALKELIHEEFGDGIMSAINFKVDFTRRPDPEGDRVVITLDGKFLDYRW